MKRNFFKVFMSVVFIAVSMQGLRADSEAKSLTVKGGTDNSSSKLNFTRFVNVYYMAADAAASWTIHSATISPSKTWTINTSPTRALGAGKADAEVATAELFGAHIHGTISKGGGSGGGTMPVFDVYGKHSGSLVLEQEKDKIIAGTSGTFVLKENGSTVSVAYWKCYLQHKQAPDWTAGAGSVTLPAAGTTAPGKYIVEAKSDSDNDKDKKTSRFIYMKIKSLKKAHINTSRKLKNGSPSVASLKTSNTITVATDPAGYEQYIVLTIPNGKGTLIRSSSDAAVWIYIAPEETSNANVNSVENIRISCTILGIQAIETIEINLYSATNDN